MLMGTCFLFLRQNFQTELTQSERLLSLKEFEARKCGNLCYSYSRNYSKPKPKLHNFLVTESGDASFVSLMNVFFRAYIRIYLNGSMSNRGLEDNDV